MGRPYKVNNKKCAVKGMLYNEARTGLFDAPLQKQTVEQLRKRLAQVKINGTQIPFLHPDEPYKYLGVAFTASLNWTYQIQKVANELKHKSDNVTMSLI